MKQILRIDGAGDQIELLAPGTFRLADGPVRRAQVEVPEAGVYSVLLEGRIYDARVEESSSGLIVAVNGYRFEIEVLDPRRWSRNHSHAGADGIQTISAPIPGKVVRVLVAS